MLVVFRYNQRRKYAAVVSCINDGILSEKDIEILKQWMKLAMSVSALFEFEEKM